MEVPIALANPNYQPPGVLAGLGPTTTPPNARKAVNDGLVVGFTFGQIKNSLRMTAITIFTHQKLASRFQDRVLDGANTMVFFLCGVHGFKAPGNDENVPRVGEDKTLPLCHWESLYLALVAEIRELYSDISLHFKTELQDGDYVLHMYGSDGCEENRPFTAFDFGSQLEEMWDLLNDARLLGPLEKAVRMENATEEYREEFGNAAFRQRFDNDFHKLDPQTIEAKLDTVHGINDPDGHTAAGIIEMLWQKHADLMNRACREKLHVEVDLAARRAHLREAASRPAQAVYEEVEAESFCLCAEHCQCRLACQFEVGICACKNQRLLDAAVYARGSHTPSTFPPTQQSSMPFSGITGSLSRMQMAGSNMQDSPSVEDYGRASRTARAYTTQSFRSRRERSDTENSELAYVPSIPRTPARGNIPIGLYSDKSGQRYPTFRKPSREHSEYSTGNYTTDPPVRKPVPEYSAPMSSPSKRSKTTSPEYALTMSPSPEPESHPASAQAATQTRPSRRFLSNFRMPKRKSGSAQTSPEPIEEDTRKPDNEFEGWDTSHIKTPRIPAKRAVNETGARHPSPTGRHSADSPVQANREPAPATIARANTADSGQLALPDFIAPRPAMRQRYVSAGGTARLQDRPEIPGFALPPAADSGFAITKEEFLNRAEEIGINTPPRTSNIPRASQESAIGSGSGSGSGRPSQDAMDNQDRGEKRDRTASNASAARAFKKLFSRQPSITEDRTEKAKAS